MGYTTVFKGHFTFCCALDDETYKLLAGLESTRRMKRKFRKTDGYGVDGEFYVAEDEPVDPATGKRISTIVDYNVPPRTQPSLWLHWIPSEDRRMLHWSGAEKFYGYVAWLEYLREKILAPKGYSLTGTVLWFGEDGSDTGAITATPEGFVIKGNAVRQGYAYGFKEEECWKHKKETKKSSDCYDCRDLIAAEERDDRLDRYYEGEDIEVNKEAAHGWSVIRGA
ncbi:hypothetical protein EMMF5_000495 [Cystobasidiomycetes sp. EMM_F5]